MMKGEPEPISKRIEGRLQTQEAFYGKRTVDSKKEEFIWANKWIGGNLPTIHLDLAGITYPHAQYRIVRKSKSYHPFHHLYVIEYVTSGKGYIEAKGIKTEVKAGDLYMIDCRIPHQYYADPEDPFEKKWLNLRGSYMEAMAPLLFGDSPYVVVALGEEAKRHMETIHDRIRRTAPADSEQMLLDLMQWIFDLFLLVDRYRRNEKEPPSRLERIVRYIEQNICLDIRVSDLTKLFYISSSTLYRMFMTAYGLSPKDFILHKKVEAAKRLIADEELTIHTIAAVLNFYDSRHFFRIFRQYTGMSPTAYRELLLKETTEELLP